MLSPQWSSPAPGRRSQPPPVEKSPPAKRKMPALERRQFQAEAEQRQQFTFPDFYALLRIFEYLNDKDLPRAARVCRMWSDLAVHPSLWKTVRMKNREVTDWDELAEGLKRRGTQHLDLREMWIASKSDNMWKKFVSVIPRVTNLVKLELCLCPAVVVEEVIKNCPQLEVLSAMSIVCNSFLNLESIGNLKRCQELKLRGVNYVCLKGDLSPLQTLTQLTHLSMTNVKKLCTKRIDIVESLTNLEMLELGEYLNFPEEYGTRLLLKLHNLKRLRLQKRLSAICTFDIHEGVVKLENVSEIIDWDALAEVLTRRGTQHLDLKEMGIASNSDFMWRKFVSVIPRVTSLVKLELGECPAIVVERVMKKCPQLKVLHAMSIENKPFLNLESVENLKCCQELKLGGQTFIFLKEDLSPLQTLTQLTHLSVTNVKNLGKSRIDILESLTNLETLELGQCYHFLKKFGMQVLPKLHNLKRLRLVGRELACCSFEILKSVSKLENLSQLELINFYVKKGFDKYLANCKNIKRLLIISTSFQISTTNNMVLGGVTELSNNLTHFVWGFTDRVLDMAKRFIKKNQMNKKVTGDFIQVLKPVPCLKLIEDIEGDNSLMGDNKVLLNLTNTKIDVLSLPQLQKILLAALPKTRVEILKSLHRHVHQQRISDSTAQ